MILIPSCHPFVFHVAKAHRLIDDSKVDLSKKIQAGPERPLKVHGGTPTYHPSSWFHMFH